MEAIFDVLKLLDSLLAGKTLYDFYQTGAWTLLLRPSFLIPSGLIFWGYLRAWSGIEREIVDQEKFEKSNLLFGLAGGYFALSKRGRRYWWARLFWFFGFLIFLFAYGKYIGI